MCSRAPCPRPQSCPAGEAPQPQGPVDVSGHPGRAGRRGAGGGHRLRPAGGNTDGYGDDFDDGDHDASSIVDIFQSDVPTIPRADTDPDLRFYCEKAGEEKLTIQQVYQQVNPATVLVLTDLGEKASVGTGSS